MKNVNKMVDVTGKSVKPKDKVLFSFYHSSSLRAGIVSHLTDKGISIYDEYRFKPVHILGAGSCNRIIIITRTEVIDRMRDKFNRIINTHDLNINGRP